MTRDEAFALWASKHDMADGLPWETDRKVLLAVFTAGWDAHEEAGKQTVMFPTVADIMDSAPTAEAIYDAYPRHEGRGAAIKAIDKATVSGKVSQHCLMQAVKDYAEAVKTWPATSRFTVDGRSLIPLCSTWMNQERWTDDRAVWQRGSVKHTPSQFGQKYT